MSIPSHFVMETDYSHLYVLEMLKTKEHTNPSRLEDQGSVGPPPRRIPARWSSTTCSPLPYR